MPKKRTTTERTEAGVRLVVVQLVHADRVTWSDYRVTSLRDVQIQYLEERPAAEAAFEAEVAASRSDPRLGPIIN